MTVPPHVERSDCPAWCRVGGRHSWHESGDLFVTGPLAEFVTFELYRDDAEGLGEVRLYVQGASDADLSLTDGLAFLASVGPAAARVAAQLPV